MTGIPYPQNGIPFAEKSAIGALDWTLDFSLWLASGETITTATVVATSGVVVATTTTLPAGAGPSVQMVLSGGTLGSTYLVTCAITTSQGRIDQRSFNLNIVQR